MELYELGIKAAREGLAKGEFSSVDLTQAIIDRYHAKNAEIGAYLTFDEGQALELARANPKAVPIAVKDLINVAGQPCTCASKILKGYVSPYDATVIKNMKSHDFIPAGRVNMDEFAMGSSTENSGLGVTRNPYDLGRVPGGSSGGSAAAVGGNLCIAALGTDTGGSIRQPASFCNCVGVKPSYGRVSRYGVTAFASSLDQVGPMTKSVEDAAILLGAFAGHDEMDGTTPKDPVPDYAAALEGASMKGVRLGVAKEYFDVNGLDPEVKRITEEALAKCEKAGAELVEVSLPHTEYAMEPRKVRRRSLRAPLRRSEGCLLPLHEESRRGLRSRGEATHHHGDVRSLERVLRRLLRARPEGPYAHNARLCRGLREVRRASFPLRPDARVQVQGASGPAHDVPERPLHDSVRACRRLRVVGSGRLLARHENACRRPVHLRGFRGGKASQGLKSI